MPVRNSWTVTEAIIQLWSLRFWSLRLRLCSLDVTKFPDSFA